MESFVLNTISGVTHGFGTLHEPILPFARKHWHERAMKTQVHGVNIAIATENRQQVGPADGWYTEKRNILLTLVNADCYPVLFSRKDGTAIAALHIGWRGAFNGIIYNLKSLINNQGDDLANWVAGIGPGAMPCCYEVSQELIDAFSERYSINSELLNPQPRKLDLLAVIAHQLRDVGITCFDSLSLCTICSVDFNAQGETHPVFHSYRRDGNKEVQVSAIMML